MSGLMDIQVPRNFRNTSLYSAQNQDQPWLSGLSPPIQSINLGFRTIVLEKLITELQAFLIHDRPGQIGLLTSFWGFRYCLDKLITNVQAFLIQACRLGQALGSQSLNSSLTQVLNKSRLYIQDYWKAGWAHLVCGLPGP